MFTFEYLAHLPNPCIYEVAIEGVFGVSCRPVGVCHGVGVCRFLIILFQMHEQKEKGGPESRVHTG